MEPLQIKGPRFVATLKPGWRAKLIGDDRVLLVHADEDPRFIDVATITEGDELPRDTDEAVIFGTQLGGK